MSKNEHLFPYLWKLSDGFPAKGMKHHGKKVFSCFCCGGGSSMGYKLAGYDCLGGVEIDPKVAATYERNLHPKILYNLDIRDFNALEDLHAELYNLDILDGSPPCTTFSMAGKREKVWGKEKTFKEGQKKQRLDDLVFVYCDTIAKLRPKVCVLENVEGLIRGNGKVYAKRITEKLTAAGYRVQVFLLNAYNMGVPSYRPRVFFIGLRNDYDLPLLQLAFNEPPILFGEITEHENTGDISQLSPQMRMIFENVKPNETSFQEVLLRKEGRASGFGQCIFHPHLVAPTFTTRRSTSILSQYPRRPTFKEVCQCCTFPIDYRAEKQRDLEFYCGMSVPPVMCAQIANQIFIQWLSKINDNGND